MMKVLKTIVLGSVPAFVAAAGGAGAMGTDAPADRVMKPMTQPATQPATGPASQPDTQPATEPATRPRRQAGGGAGGRG